MTMNWKLDGSRSRTRAVKSANKPDAFADPLEGREWDGLGWSIPLIARLVRSARPESKNGRKIKQVERFTVPAGVKSVCVF